MFARINLRLLAVIAVLLAITYASLLNPERGENDVQRRQNDGGATKPPTGGATTDDSVKGNTSPSTSSTSQSSSTTPSTSPTPTTSSTSSSTTSTSKSDSQSKSSTSQSSSQSKTSSKEGDKTTIIKNSPTVIVVKTTMTIDGVTQETDVSVTSSVPVSTDVSLQNTSSSEGKGMSANTKRTVIGVVVGIVGAIVLGALVILAWRIWGRRRSDDDDDTLSPFTRGTSAHGQEKTSDVGSAPSPFKTTLDQYHNPNARTNVSSNF